MKTVNESLHYYLSQVLGMQGMILPANEVEAASKLKSVRVVFYNDQNLTAPASELLVKMIEAMKLAPSDVRLAFAINEIGDTQYVVNFTEKMLPNLKCPQILTQSPESLIHQPANKKKVWVDLQKVMRYLQNS
jgi:hypothetical protein